jgi:hypothetical protein
MTKQVAYRLEEELLDKIKELAAKENRNGSNMAETLLYEAVMRRVPSWKPRNGPAK